MPDFAQPAWLWLLVPATLLVVWYVRRTPPPRTRIMLAGALRVSALAALALALAGPLAGSSVRQVDLVFALDVSASVDRESVAAGLDLVNRAREANARAGLVVFGADAAVESFVRQGGEPIRELAAQVERGGTDLGRAIEVAVGAFEAPAQRRIALLSDGRENLGDARAAAAVARSLGVEVHTFAVEKRPGLSEVHLQSVDAPARVRVHEPYNVQAVVHATQAGPARLSLVRNGVLLEQRQVSLAPGINAYAFVEQADKPGLQDYEAIVEADGDGEPENNRYPAFVQVLGAPRVLHAAGGSAAGRYVGAALSAQGLVVDAVRAEGLPASLHELLGYDLVILDNVSGFEVSLAKMELLERYVRDAGGGVVMLGGDRSYAAGGYHATPVERLLPVSMSVKTEVKIPSLSVVFVLDRSGSMGTTIQGEEKLAIAKRAALSSIDLLNRLDRVGVLAFDSGRDWVVPPTEAAMRRPIEEKLRELKVGGGTDIHQAVEEAHRVMRREAARVKHIIVLSDGITDGEKNFEALGRRIAADGITISTVAMGADADKALMARLAELGKGRYYHTEDPTNVPRIFTSETLTVTRELVVEGTIRPRPAAAGEPLQGFAADAFPLLGGYQRTYAKPAAQVLLAAGDDPLLATWRYGLGRAAAFTSDLGGRWGRQWVQWPAFGRFVAQTARWTMRQRGTEAFVPHVRWHGRRGELAVDVFDRDERFVNGLALQATLIEPGQEPRRIELEQVAPGRYAAGLTRPAAGRYYVTLSNTGDAGQLPPYTFGVAVPYSAEYLDRGVDRELLHDLAAATGGRALPLAAADLASLTEPSPRPVRVRAQVWWPLLALALALLVIDVAVRRVTFADSWRTRLAKWRRGRAVADTPAADFEALRAQAVRESERPVEEAGARPSEDATVARARLHVSGRRR